MEKETYIYNKEQLEDIIKKISSKFPCINIRIAKKIGKRISYLASNNDELNINESKLELDNGYIIYYAGNNTVDKDEIIQILKNH